MFAEQFLEVWPELGALKKAVLEDMLRIVHFGAQALLIALSSKQNVVWFTDEDSIVSNAAHQQLFGKLAQSTVKMMLPQEELGEFAFGLTGADDGSLEIEDPVAIPDLVAGALCELLDVLSKKGLHVTSRVVLTRPPVSKKTDLICEWISNTSCPLKKFGLTFDVTGPQVWDWRPTFFALQGLHPNYCGATCPARQGRQHLADPVRFDIADYLQGRNQGRDI